MMPQSDDDAVSDLPELEKEAEKKVVGLIPEIPAEIVDELESLPDEIRPGLTRIFAQMSYSGPLPPPAQYGQYEVILPGAADRILKLAELNSQHKRDVELIIVKAQVDDAAEERRERQRGQLYGLAIGIVTVVAGAITAACGQPWAGGFIGTSGVAGLVSVFVIGRKAEQEKEAKADAE